MAIRHIECGLGSSIRIIFPTQFMAGVNIAMPILKSKSELKPKFFV